MGPTDFDDMAESRRVVKNDQFVDSKDGFDNDHDYGYSEMRKRMRIEKEEEDRG